MAAPRLRRLSFLLLFCLLTALFLPAALAAGPSGGRLYVLTPKVPRAACYLVDEVRRFYASLGESSLELFSSASAFAWDGDLNGTRIATDGGYLIENASGPEAYGLTYHSKGAATTTGQPFSFYDSAGKPSGQYLYAKKSRQQCRRYDGQRSGLRQRIRRGIRPVHQLQRPIARPDAGDGRQLDQPSGAASRHFQGKSPRAL